MALTAAQQTDAYRFFSIAFDAAPGITYMNQLADAYGAGMTTKQIVNVFTTKEQFTSKYPTFLTNQTFATNLINNVVGASATDAAKAEAVADVVAAINAGFSRGDVIYQIFTNLAGKPATDAKWSGTAKLMANKVAVAQYYTETLMGNTTNLTTLQTVLAGVTSAADVSTPAAIQALLGDVFNAQGQSFTLTANADQVPGLLGSAATVSTSGNDVYVATNTTLSSADRLVDSAGADKLKYSSQVASTHAAFEMKGIETLEVTADQGNAVSFDLSGSEGLTLVKTLNSTGNVTYSQITTLADIEVNNVTNGANVTVAYQDSIVAGTADDVDLTLVGNSNVTPVGTIWVGRTADSKTDINDVRGTGVETISAIVSGAAATVTRLDSDISTLNVSGNQNLTIHTALNSTIDTVAAGSFTGALNINLTGNVTGRGALPPAPGATNTDGVLSITTGTGNDVIDLLNGTATTTVAEAAVPLTSGADVGTVVRNVTISTGAGNDSVEAGLGDDNINLGEGNDTLVMTVNGLTVADIVVGGAGADTLIFNTSDSISKSEAERVTQVETFDVRNFVVPGTPAGPGSTIVVSDNLLNTADGGMFTVTTANATRANTTDLTNVTFSNTNKFTLTGNTSGAAMDTVIADDATVNAKAILNFGQDAFTAGGVYQGADTLRIVDGGNFTFDDFANVTGLDVIDVRASSTIAQTYNIQLTQAMIDNMDSGNNTVGDAFDTLTILVDRNVPQGSVLNLNVTALSALDKTVLVRTNSNVTVNLVDNTGAVVQAAVTNATFGVVTVQSSLQFTENSDNLVGAGTFSADSLDQFDLADAVSATGGADILQVNFAVQNGGADLNDLFNNFAEDAANRLETITFTTNNNVTFGDVHGAKAMLSGVTTVNFGSGADTIAANTGAGTYNFGQGVGRYTEVAGSAVITAINMGTSADFVTFGAAGTAAEGNWTAADTIAMSTGADTVTMNSRAAFNTSTFTKVSGVNTVVYNTTGAGVSTTLTIDDNMVDQADNGNVLNVTVSDASTYTKAADASSFTAAGVVAGNAVNVTIAANAVIAGVAAGNNIADFIGGAGNDTFTMAAADVAADKTVIRGNGGQDTIVLRADGAATATNEQWIEYATSNDGAATFGTAIGADVISGFQTTIDKISLALGEGLVGTIDTTTLTDANADGVVQIGELAAANGAIAWVTDAAVVFGNGVVAQPAITGAKTGEALLLTHLSTNLTDADLVTEGFANVLAKLNVLVTTTGAANAGGLIVVQGQTDTAIYFYGEQNGTAGVQAADLKLIGVVDGTQLVTGDFQIA